MFADIVSGDRRLSGADLERRASRVAGGLSALGLSAGDVICLLMRNDFPFLEVALGAERIGVATVPLNWHGSAEELLFVLKDSGAKLLVAHADLLEIVREGLPNALPAIVIDVPPEIAGAYRVRPTAISAAVGDRRYEDWLATASDFAGPAVSPPFRLTYTSGSTGQPKGVIRERGTDEQAARAARSVRETHSYTVDGCRAIMTAPLYHSAPLAYGLTYVRHGELLVLQTKFDAAELLRLIERYRLTHFYAVATMFGRLLALPEQDRDGFDRSSLRSVVHGAAMCPPEIKRAMINWLGPIINECYAATETALITFCTSEEWLTHPGTVGRAAEGVELRIVDDHDVPLPAGAVGEILIRSDAVRLVRYLGRPEATAELRRGDWVTMGDVGHLDADGYLWISDRKKDLVISGGVNIFPAEVEKALHAMPEVRDCIVFGVADADLGEALVALVELQPGHALSATEAKAYLGLSIGRLRVPKEIRFVDCLPREDTGKLARRKARAVFLAAAVD